MSKTPEQMAAEWYWANVTEQAPVVMLTNPVKHPPCPRKAFLAGYKAAKDQPADAANQSFRNGYKAGQDDMQRQLAVGEDVVRDLLNAPQWISVKERLPEKEQYVLWYNPTLLKPMEVAMISPNWNGSLEHNTYYYWMPLPQPPKEEK